MAHYFYDYLVFGSYEDQLSVEDIPDTPGYYDLRVIARRFNEISLMAAKAETEEAKTEAENELIRFAGDTDIQKQLDDDGWALSDGIHMSELPDIVQKILRVKLIEQRVAAFESFKKGFCKVPKLLSLLQTFPVQLRVRGVRSGTHDSR